MVYTLALTNVADVPDELAEEVHETLAARDHLCEMGARCGVLSNLTETLRFDGGFLLFDGGFISFDGGFLSKVDRPE